MVVLVSSDDAVFVGISSVDEIVELVVGVGVIMSDSFEVIEGLEESVVRLVVVKVELELLSMLTLCFCFIMESSLLEGLEGRTGLGVMGLAIFL